MLTDMIHSTVDSCQPHISKIYNPLLTESAKVMVPCDNGLDVGHCYYNVNGLEMFHDQFSILNSQSSIFCPPFQSSILSSQTSVFISQYSSFHLCILYISASLAKYEPIEIEFEKILVEAMVEVIFQLD